MHPLGRLLVDAARGRYPARDGGWHRVPPWRPGLGAVVAFTAHAVLALDGDPPPGLGLDGFGAAHHPDVVRRLAGPAGWIDSLDVLLVGRGDGGPAALVRRDDLRTHPRARLAEGLRDDVVVHGRPAGPDLLTLGTGIGGLPELSLEVATPGRGRGRALARDGLRLAGPGATVVAAVTPGNAASLRALLAAGLQPVGAIQLFRPGRG